MDVIQSLVANMAIIVSIIGALTFVVAVITLVI